MTYNNYSHFTNLISFSNVILSVLSSPLNYKTILEKAVLTFKYNYILLKFFY